MALLMRRRAMVASSLAVLGVVIVVARIAAREVMAFVPGRYSGPAPSALRGAFVARRPRSQPAEASHAGGLAVVAFASAAVAARAMARSRNDGRQPSPVAVAAAMPDVPEGAWQPRTTGWEEADLRAERSRVQNDIEAVPASYTGPVYAGPASVTTDFIDKLIDMQEKGQLLPKKFTYMMLLDVIDILRKENTLQDVKIPAGKELIVCGDLHGQYWDFMNLLKLAGRPSPDAPFLFNGDFVDRGSWSIEVITVLLAMKLKDPAFVYLNRGNHEMIETNILYGFCGEVGAKFNGDMQLFDLFSEAFRNLPLCHRVDDKVLVLHAGLPGPDPRVWMPGQTHDPTDAIPMSRLADLNEIAKVDRYLEITPESYVASIGPCTAVKEEQDRRHLIDMLWGDPRGGIGYGPSYRKFKGVYMFGPDVSEEFCKRNSLQCIIRSHEVKADGSRWDHPHVLTVFSAPNYLDTGNNKGAFLKLTRPDGGDVKIEQISYGCVPHPELKPMHWQEYITENHPYLTRKMKKKVEATTFDEFGDSDFEGLMNFDEWEPDEAEQFQDAFKVDEYGRDL